MTRSSFAKGVAFAACCFAALGSQCSDAPTTPGKGGWNNDNGDCSPNPSSAWTENHLGVRIQSPTCPYEVASNSASVIFAGIDTTSISYVTGSSDADLVVTDTVTGDFVGPPDDGAGFVQSTYSDTMYVAYLAMTGQPGEYAVPSTNDTLMVDEIASTANNMAVWDGASSAWLLIHGHVSATAQDLLGNNGAVEDVPAMWRSKPAWDTTGYTYAWYLDGTQVATSDEYTASLSSGLHTLSNVTIRADNSRDSVVLSVKAYDAAINGPTSVQPFATCTWYGSASGATSPYSYNWTSPTSSSGQYFTWQNGSNDGEAFYLSLNVTDAAGYTIPLTETIHVSNNAPICPDSPIHR